MTPIELRKKAFAQIEAAKKLLPDFPSQSFYNAGYAMEFILKARLCNYRNWLRLPHNHAEARNWSQRDGFNPRDKIFTHNIDELLKFSNSMFVQRSTYSKIDWDKAMMWSEQARYEPEGVISLEDAGELINQVESVVNEFCIYELVQQLQKIEIKVSDQYGPFHCFGLVISPHNPNKWVPLVAYLSPTRESHYDRLNTIKDYLDTEIDQDLNSFLDPVANLYPYDNQLESLYLAAKLIGSFQHSTGNSIRGNFPPHPNGYYITVVLWDETKLNEIWKEKT